MVQIRIGTDQRELDETDEGWICQQINRRRSDGLNVCVQITIRTSRLDMIMSTPQCASGFGGGRSPNPQEREVLDLWENRQLDRHDFSCGDVVAFLKQLRRLV